jgi:transposase
MISKMRSWLVRRRIADELILSFVPDGEQRIWRSLIRMKVQVTRDRVRLQNQMECLLEEMRIKLSIVVSNLLGASGLRNLHALAQGETDPKNSAKGNKYLRRVLNQAAHAAAAKKGSHVQLVFRRLLPRLGYKSAISAIAHRLCRVVWKILHEGVRFIEQGHEVGPREKKQRAQMLARALRKLGYEVTITPINQLAANPAI